MNGLGDIRLYEAIGAMRDKADELEAERDQLADENARLFELAQILVHCMGEVDNCDTCRINDNPCEVSVDGWFACDSLRDLLRECGVIE